MGMYMYVSKEDRIYKRKVADGNLNEVFQEALRFDPSLMIEEYPKLFKNKWWKRSHKEETFYEIYHETHPFDESPYQARVQIVKKK